VIRRVARMIVGGETPRHSWKGVYAGFREVPAAGAGHATAAHIERTARMTREVRESGAIPAEYGLLPLVATLAARDAPRISVLDVGGGLGIGYVALRASAPALPKVEYVVVDVPEVCAAGAAFFADDRAITFQSALPGDEAVGTFDLVQFCSSLQYVEDYAAMLARVCAYRARFIYLLKIPVGGFPTFATGQYNLPDSVVPVWFFNEAELVRLLAHGGYRLVYRGTHDRVYDTTNFDPAHRVRQYAHLLFSRDGAA
jgi:putative methyltransferase (TIGR04325 family)